MSDFTSTTWTLENIIAKVRSVTGTPSQDQLTDQQIADYVNQYFSFSMPSELKVQIQNNFLDFKTVQGQNVYSFPGAYLTDSPGAYADGFPLIFYEDPDIFYQDWPQQYSVDSVGVGAPPQVTFTGTTQASPIIQGTYFITDGTQVLQDNGEGVLVAVAPATGSGTINYATGAFSATFGVAPLSTATIYDKYIACQENRPQGVLFFENEFTLMPVPDQVYQIRMQGFISPVQLVNYTDIPAQPEWGPLIALGASLDIFDDRGDKENWDRYFPVFKRYENVALSRTVQQYTPEQGVPRF